MIKFRDVVRLLKDKRELPVKPMDVARLLLEGGVREEIVFVEVDIKADILRGKLVQVETSGDIETYIPVPYSFAGCGLISKIYFAAKQDDDIKGLSVIKELLHIVDPPSFATATREQIASLCQRIILPSEILALISNGEIAGNEHLLIDLMSDYRAVVLMMPEKLRIMLREAYDARKLTLEEVSRLSGIPLYYAKVVMSDQWVSFRERLIEAT